MVTLLEKGWYGFDENVAADSRTATGFGKLRSLVGSLRRRMDYD
jgi:hypothetical protein